MIAETKTIITGEPVEAFIESVEPPVRREEARILDRQFRKVTRTAPRVLLPQGKAFALSDGRVLRPLGGIRA